MKIAPCLLSSWVTIVLSFAPAGIAKAQNEWRDIRDPAEIRKLVSGKAIDLKHAKQYFRKDGNAAIDFGGTVYPGLSVRKWTINDDGKLCVAPFSKPSRISECYTFQRTRGNPAKYRYRSRTGFHNFEVIDTVPAKLSKAVNDTAGALVKSGLKRGRSECPDL
ncbi:MAG: hypothetical protein P8Y71_20930 [Pseudolabrys sp.]